MREKEDFHLWIKSKQKEGMQEHPSICVPRPVLLLRLSLLHMVWLSSQK